MPIPVLDKVMTKVFGTRNERMVKRYLKIVDAVSAMEGTVTDLTDAQLKKKTEEFKEKIKGGATPETMMPEVFAVAREVMDRSVGIRNVFNPTAGFDPAQLQGKVRAAYDRTKTEMDAAEAKEPTGDFLGCEGPVPGWMYVDIPVEIYKAVRELYPQSKPPFRARPFDVQIIGAMVLYEGRIAEMRTGEGKTIVAPLACYLSAIQGLQVHVVTVNDYLVQRDRDWTFPFFRALGMTVGAIHPYHMQGPQLKAMAYRCNVVYGTTAEFGFDYLRDNMKLSVQEQVQRKRDIAIVDEVDSTLIDEARTPLIISGPAHQHSPRYALADKLARDLQEKQKEWNEADERVESCKVQISSLEGDIRNTRDKERIPEFKAKIDALKKELPSLEAARDQFTQYYEVELDKKKASLTHEGIAEAQRVAALGSFYVGDNIDLPHLLEQSIRAHSCYQRDRDYVVAPDEDGTMSVVIVDQNTGRKMVGRQWSDGLHQAVEAKEGVTIKQETQTMATITIQNFFKLYKKLAGMTGTADTEATEFYEIYALDVIAIPTNVPVVRADRNDLVFISLKDKWEAIVDEIKAFHDAGRPVLVGTTSVDKSEKLSQMLTRKHNIKHEVLNAKQHDREAEIIAHAGELGAVMIATNMAGRGTDIKMTPITKEQLIEHWKRRGIAPREVTPEMSEEEIVKAIYRHITPKELGITKNEAAALSDDEVRLRLVRHWCAEHCWDLRKDPEKMTEEEAVKELDRHGSYLMHKLRLFNDTADLGGLHVIGTERHESRRIDNQLRGRSGRQGDNGSSRFFLSLEDDLMKMFAGETMLKVLSRLGMKEGDKIEHGMLTRAVERAQRKVEERNFLWRKNILEFDEIMNIQRGEFYGMRQRVLEGREVKELIFEYIDSSVEDAVHTYLDKVYARNCIGEWIREHLNVSIDSSRLKGKDRDDLQKLVRIDAKEEAVSKIEITIGEYMSEVIEHSEGTTDEEEWNLKAMADWANANFKAGVTEADFAGKSKEEVARRIEASASQMIDDIDLSPLDQFLVPNYGAQEVAKWAKNKFGADINADEYAAISDLEEAAEKMMAEARQAYERRELSYGIDFALEMTSAGMQQNPQAALTQFCAWVRSRYGLDWEPTALPSPNPLELRKILVEEAAKWDDARITKRAEAAVAAGSSPEQLDAWMQANINMRMADDERKEAGIDPTGYLKQKIKDVMRAELTQFERWVLLQIVDQAWKDHLYAMDQLRDSIGLRSFAQKDSRIEYKREGARLYDEMQTGIQDRVTDLIFKAKLTAQVRNVSQAPVQPSGDGSAANGVGAPQQASQVEMQPVQRPAPARTAAPAIAAAAAAAAGTGTATQRRDLEAAERAGSSSEGAKTGRRPVKAVATVGRNEPCPCGSGKKYKQCCGKS